jgi:ketosteroid isomerase-like protein
VTLFWRTSFLCGLLAAASVTATGAQERAGRSDQQILIQLEREWDAAFQAKDLPFIERVLADDFVATYADGSRGDKAKELALTAAFNQQVDSSVLDDFAVKVYGDTAVVWFTKRLTGPRQGRPVEVTFRYIDVFVWRDGRWQCVATQSTKVGG